MAIRIKSRTNESVGQMLRRFKKMCEKEGLIKEVKRRQYYEKPSERNRRDTRRNIARSTMRPLGEPGPRGPGRAGPGRGPAGRGPAGRGPAGRGPAGRGPARGGSRGPSRDF